MLTEKFYYPYKSEKLKKMNREKKNNQSSKEKSRQTTTCSHIESRYPCLESIKTTLKSFFCFFFCFSFNKIQNKNYHIKVGQSNSGEGTRVLWKTTQEKATRVREPPVPTLGSLI